MIDQNIVEVARLLGLDPSTLPRVKANEAASECEPKIITTVNSEDLTDEEFEMLYPFLPAEPKRDSAISNHQVLGALLWAQSSARPLTHAPRSFGSAEAVRKRAERWALLGVGERLLQAIGGLPLRSNIELTIRRLASDLSRRGDRIRRSRESLRQ